ncbi:MAG TPA: hypothetical protein PLT65_04870 [Bacilli bacterium]|nr:hypothetical protein [Bacilli bacterium]
MEKGKQIIVINPSSDGVIKARQVTFATRTTLTTSDIKNLKLLQIKDINKKEFFQYSGAWKQAIKDSQLSILDIKKLVFSLEEANDEKDIEKLAQEVISSLRQVYPASEYYKIKYLTDGFFDQSKMGLVAFTKQLMFTKYEKMLSRFSKDEQDQLYNTLISGSDNNLKETIKYLEESLNDNHSQKAIENGMLLLSYRIMMQTVKNTYEKRTHLCWENCANAQTKKCAKVHDLEKKVIASYPFVQSGYQVLNPDGIVSEFSVHGCHNYEQEKDEPASIENLRKLRTLMKGITIEHFNSETLEEANMVRGTMIRNGTLRAPHEYRNYSR